MPDRQPNNQRGEATNGSEQAASSAPAITLPKGGGAIRGIGEKFAANPVTGTGTMTVPLASSPGRAGFGPQLSLAYDSGAGNGPFGFGWQLSLLATPIKTWELLTGKILAALIPTVAISWLFGAIFIGGMAAVSVSQRVFAAIVSPGWLTVFLLCTPLLAVIAIAAMVAISARVNDPHTAQQLSAWVVLPFLLFFFGQITGRIVLGPLTALGAALALGLIAAAAVWGATRLFQREVILTKWT